MDIVSVQSTEFDTTIIADVDDPLADTRRVSIGGGGVSGVSRRTGTAAYVQDYSRTAYERKENDSNGRVPCTGIPIYQQKQPSSMKNKNNPKGSKTKPKTAEDRLQKQLLELLEKHDYRNYWALRKKHIKYGAHMKGFTTICHRPTQLDMELEAHRFLSNSRMHPDDPERLPETFFGSCAADREHMRKKQAKVEQLRETASSRIHRSDLFSETTAGLNAPAMATTTATSTQHSCTISNTVGEQLQQQMQALGCRRVAQVKAGLPDEYAKKSASVDHTADGTIVQPPMVKYWHVWRGDDMKRSAVKDFSLSIHREPFLAPEQRVMFRSTPSEQKEVFDEAWESARSREPGRPTTPRSVKDFFDPLPSGGTAAVPHSGGEERTMMASTMSTTRSSGYRGTSASPRGQRNPSFSNNNDNKSKKDNQDDDIASSFEQQDEVFQKKWRENVRSASASFWKKNPGNTQSLNNRSMGSMRQNLPEGKPTSSVIPSRPVSARPVRPTSAAAIAGASMIPTPPPPNHAHATCSSNVRRNVNNNNDDDGVQKKKQQRPLSARTNQSNNNKNKDSNGQISAAAGGSTFLTEPIERPRSAQMGRVTSTGEQQHTQQAARDPRDVYAWIRTLTTPQQARC